MEKSLKFTLKEHGLALKKAYGQNFLTDVELLNTIVEKAGVSDSATVLEIGCGAGALTKVLCTRARKVVGYEIDTRLKPVLNETLNEFNNVELVFKDVMKENIADIEKKLGDDYLLVANLPYYITTPIVMNFLENSKKIKGMIIMVQEEVALRFASAPSTSDYGAITVAINIRGKAEVVLRVPREKFTPVPNVDSAVVKIDIEKDKFKGVDLREVRNVVRGAFSSRRKMLVNNLSNVFKIGKSDAEKILELSNINKTARGESLSAQDFVDLCAKMKEFGVKL